MEMMTAEQISKRLSAMEIADMIDDELNRHPRDKTREWADYVDTLRIAYQLAPLGI